MFSTKKNVLELVSLLKFHGIKKCVLCPGSRDIPLVQSILQCDFFDTYSVTDERSAGFFANGLSLQSNKEPVAVVVTSGSALLNLHPAVSEAFYQEIPLLVISADRPLSWIGQMDGQTLPQANVFNTLVKKSVALVEVQSDEDLWFCNRMINEAILELKHRNCGPVHINVPISDPFFDFSTPELPKARGIKRFSLGQMLCLGSDLSVENKFAQESCDKCCSFDNDVKGLANIILGCKRIMLIAGQDHDGYQLANINDLWPKIGQYTAVVAESISNVKKGPWLSSQIDLLVTELINNEELSCRQECIDTLKPELVITLGGHIISKQLKKFLRANKPKYHLHVSAQGEVVDLFKCLTHVVEMSPHEFLNKLYQACELLNSVAEGKDGSSICPTLIEQSKAYSVGMQKLNGMLVQPKFSYSHMQAVKMLVEQVSEGQHIHWANSSTVRYAQLFNRSDVEKNLIEHSNRGVNGIEGSLSTAIGYAAATYTQSGQESPLNFIVIGDLSFFYDMNALWNGHVSPKVRILVLNNSGGEIFHALPGLELSNKEQHYVTAQHLTRAEGWAKNQGFTYLSACTEAQLKEHMSAFVKEESSVRPMLLEVFTDATTDAKALKRALAQCKQTLNENQK